MGFVAAGLVAAWLVLAALATVAGAVTLRLLRRPQPWPAATPPVLVLVPVRGAGPVLPGFLVALAAQDWPDWRVAFAVEAADDPAHPLLARYVAAHPGRATLAVAGPAEGRGQKVQNLLAALRELRSGDAAVVTLDADTLPPPGQLRALLRPVLTGQGAIATGYRWILPMPGAGLATEALSLIEAGIATLPRSPSWNICWGGATAIGRDAMDRLDLPRLWDRAMSDDLVLTRAARAAGLLVYAPLTVRPPSPVALDVRGVLEFGARQYRLLRLHLPAFWPLVGLGALVPALGGAAALAGLAAGDPAALACIGLAVLLHGIRIRLRCAIAAAILPPEAAAEARRVLGQGTWLRLAAGLLAMAAWLGSAFGREIAWAGRRYRVDREGQVTGMRRA
ncbi:glycosyltransferase [Dankookia rubra]|uniref:Glycosyltransferase n=1 Tax=Dankookia rubra TaxID=1442381 RepID=A0A4V3AAJ0_9PROT|nr:glycosyltransferase [Dankookia rubra]TDH63505.1 glycosyltransferase [Dankookia rubra]